MVSNSLGLVGVGPLEAVELAVENLGGGGVGAVFVLAVEGLGRGGEGDDLGVGVVVVGKVEEEGATVLAEVGGVPGDLLLSAEERAEAGFGHLDDWPSLVMRSRRPVISPRISSREIF